EIAVRRALGAGAGVIVRQLLSESFVLSVAGGLSGLLVALWLLRGFAPLLPPGLPMVGAVSIDARVFVFAVAVVLSASLVFGLAPITHAVGLDVVSTIRGAGRGSTDTRGRARWMIVSAELGVSVVLLIGAGLLARSLWRVVDSDPGFHAAPSIVFDVRLPWM